MALIGYQRKAERKNGGIRTLGLIAASDVTSVSYSEEDRALFELTLAAEKKFTKYEFREDEAEYSENISLVHHSPVVTHELRFVLDKMGSDSIAALDSILSLSEEGLIAVVRTMNDDIFLVGYSPRFDKERPLRVESVTSTTGKQLREETTATVVLQSIDTDLALPFIDDFDTLFSPFTIRVRNVAMRRPVPGLLFPI